MSPHEEPTPSRPTRPDRRERVALASNIDGPAPHIIQTVGAGRVGVDVDAPIDARVDLIAARQRGRVHRWQLRAADVAESAIDRRLRSGRLVHEHRCVYRLPHTESVPLGAETGALLAAGFSSALSHHSSATLRGLRSGVARPIHLTIPHSTARSSLSGVIVHRSRILIAADITLHEGLPVTTVARTLLDVAATLPDRDVERLLDQAVHVQRLVTYPQIRRVLARSGRHPGRARLERVLDGHTRSTETESPPEEELLHLIRAAAITEPEHQVWLLDYRLDLHWPDHGLAVEVDAYGTHGSRRRFEADRRRDARLLAECGIAVIRVTDVAIRERPFEVVALISRAIAERLPRAA